MPFGVDLPARHMDVVVQKTTAWLDAVERVMSLSSLSLLKLANPKQRSQSKFLEGEFLVCSAVRRLPCS